MSEAPATIYVESRSVACDGGEGALGHPRVFLAIDQSDQIDCPYCGLRFIYDPANAHDAAEAAPTAKQKGAPSDAP